MAESKDYVQIAVGYAKDASARRPKGTYGKWVILAAKRFLKDLKRAKARLDPPFLFDRWHACDPCDFIEKLPHVEGSWSTPNITLHPSDVFFLVNLFGFRSLDGTRRFTSALKAIARKNAKSTLAAAIGLYCETCEGEVGPQVVAAATTGSQARIVFNVAKRMVEMTPDLREAFMVEPYANALPCYQNGGTFKPINAKASTQDGLNPSTVILDEIHAHKNHDLLNVLRSAAGARVNPLFLFTTTEGYETPGPWPELRKFAQQVLEGVVEADHFFCVIYALDEQDGDFDEKAWPKANPLMSVNPILLKEIRKEAIEAKSMPGKLAEFRIKRLNRASSVASGWVNFSQWKACSGETDLTWKKLRNAKCWGGLDLASTQDLASFRLVWEIDNELYTAGLRWVPSSQVSMRTEVGLIPYHSWVASGYLKAVPGRVLDYSVVIKDIEEFCAPFNVQSIGHDPWNSAQTADKLSKTFNMHPFIQGAKSYHPAMKAFEEFYIDGRFHHGGDPILTWCASNLVVRLDANMNMAPDRKKSAEKIDDMVALLMAVGTSLTPDTPSYDDRLTVM